MRTTRRIAIAIVLLLLFFALLSRRLSFGTKSIYTASATIDENAVAHAARPPFMAAVATPQLPGASDAPSADKAGGFDGKRAYDLVARQVAFGPRPSGSPAIVQLQNFLESELKSY